MEYHIRTMTIDDYGEVAKLWQRIEGIGLSESDSRENTSKYLNRNLGLSLVAVKDEGIVGAVLCGHDGRRGYLHHFAVENASRGQGIGRALTEACLSSLSKQGIPKCNIFLLKDNEEGRRFWEHTGWKVRDDLAVLQKPTL